MKEKLNKEYLREQSDILHNTLINHVEWFKDYSNFKPHQILMLQINIATYIYLLNSFITDA